MVCIHPNQLPSGTNKKLHPRNAGPFKVLNKLSSNAYSLDFPSSLGINPTFNVANLSLYRGHDNDNDFEKWAIALLARHPPIDKIIDALNYRFVFTCRRGFHKFLLCLQNCTLSDATWIIATNF